MMKMSTVVFIVFNNVLAAVPLTECRYSRQKSWK